MTIFIIIVLLIIIGILIYRGFVLIDNVELYEKWFLIFKERIKQSNDMLDVIDKNGAFKSDDEVGWTFTYIKDVYKEIDDLFPEDELLETIRRIYGANKAKKIFYRRDTTSNSEVQQ